MESQKITQFIGKKDANAAMKKSCSKTIKGLLQYSIVYIKTKPFIHIKKSGCVSFHPIVLSSLCIAFKL